MPDSRLVAAILLLSIPAYILGRRRAVSAAAGGRLHSLPGHYGWAAVQLTVLPPLGLHLALAGAGWAGPAAQAAVALAALAGLGAALHRTRPGFRARHAVERGIAGFLLLASLVAIATTAGIVLSMLFETRRFFSLYG